MSAFASFITALIADANGVGPEILPNQLIIEVARHPEPFLALGSSNALNAAMDALRSDFVVVHVCSLVEQIPQAHDLELWRGLLRYTFRGLESWSVRSDPKGHVLAGLLLTGHFVAPNAMFWRNCPAGLESNEDLKTALSVLISWFKSDPSSAILPGASIWEREAFAAFLKADTAQDWPMVANDLPKFVNVHFSLLLGCIVQCLQRLAPLRLAAATNAVADIPLALSVTLSMTPEQLIELALNSTNARVQFISIISVSSKSGTKLSAAEQDMLEKVLAQMALDLNNWAMLMRVFNAVPTRYTALQISLGRALSAASPEAIRLYIESQMMNSSRDSNHIVVAECLRAFSNAATQSKRLLLWEMAYNKWLTWLPNATTSGSSMNSICRCALDYAVVGFIIEGMSLAAAEFERKSITRLFEAAEVEWHASIVDLHTHEYRLLTRYQPFAHAEEVRRKQADLLADTQYWIVKSADEPYLAAILPSA